MKYIFTSLLVISMLFLCVITIPNRHYFLRHPLVQSFFKKEIKHEHSPNLPQEQVHPISELKFEAKDTELTLEIEQCPDKKCLERALKDLKAKDISAFYSSQGSQYSIRKGVFTSRQKATEAKNRLYSEKQVFSTITEL